MFIIAATCTLLQLLSSVWCSQDIILRVNESTVLAYSEQLQCSPGFIYNATLDSCECYPNANVQCIENEAFLKFGSCMTYEEGEGTFLGLCISFRAHGRNVTDRIFIDLPDNLTELNDYICRPLNRKGLVCSECVDDFSPAITSFGYQCSNCTGAWYGIPLFLFLEFVPITIFYLIIIICGFSVTSAPMTSFVLYSQLAAHLFTAFTTLTTVIDNEYGNGTLYFIKLVTSFYGIWNLDFFRYLIPPFCISPQLKLIHVFFLYYISAFYPLCLIGITWTFIQLHSKNFKPLTRLWNGMKQCHCFAIRKSDSRSTIIDVFATFFLLSYTKLLYTSLYFLVFVNIWKNGERFKLASGLDPSTQYFSRNHAPFAIFAILILIGPVLLPVILLALYPVRAFRSLLEKCKVSGHSRAAVNLFVEKFYSCYRDGLDGGKDMRLFVFVPFLLRFSIFIGVLLQSFVGFWFFHFLLFGGASLLIALVQPYKHVHMNVIDSLILAVLSLIGILYMLYLELRDGETQNTTFFFIALCLNFTLPLLGFFVAITVKLIRTIFPVHLICSSKSKKEENSDMPESQNTVHNSTVTTTDIEFPDRILNPYRYVDENLDSFVTDQTP